MPSYAATSLPPAAEQAISVLGGNPARLAILSFLVRHPRSLVSEVAEGTEVSVNTVKNHVFALVDLGVLEVDPPRAVPRADRRGQRARYTVRGDVLLDRFQELAALLTLPAVASGDPATSSRATRRENS
ncbi:ArsR/SmtB family transcription factor [Microbacterium sp. NPDC089698]|uniref:ArsR/SmtB family transcription factor n=1 Tax=Microbacterium sp. NPDC089698 TaxID=3364200 RepID=UPI00380FEC17